MNYYRNFDENKEKGKKRLSSTLRDVGIASLIALGIGVGSYFMSKDKGVQVDGAPSGYELSDFNIPTKGNVNYIKLGKDTLNMDITRDSEAGTITYEGPIKYGISDPRPPTRERDMIERFSKDTREGSVTLEKRLE